MRPWHKRNIARSPIHGRDPRKSGPLLDIILGNRKASVSGRPLPAIGPGVALPDAKRQMSMPPRSVAQWPEHRSPKPGVAGSSPATPAKNQRLSLIAGIEGYIRGNIWGSGRRPLNGVRKAHKSDPGLAEHRAARGVRKVRGRNDQLAGLIEPSHDADGKPFVCAWID